MNDDDKKNKEEQEYQKKFNALPEDLKRAFTSDEVTDNIVSVGKAHGLTIDKIGELGDETGLIMLGITPTTDFIKNLADRLGVDKEKAKAIAEDINQKVFQQIRESLKKVHGIQDGVAAKVEIKKPGPVAEIPKAPIETGPGEIKPSSPIFAKKIVPIDELLDKIDSGESIIKSKAKIENAPVPPGESPIASSPVAPSSGIRTMFNDVKSAVSGMVKTEKEPPVNLPVEEKASLIKSENSAPSSTLGVESQKTPSVFPATEKLSPDEIKSAVEKALGGKITMPPKGTTDIYREPIE